MMIVAVPFYKGIYLALLKKTAILNIFKKKKEEEMGWEGMG